MITRPPMDRIKAEQILRAPEPPACSCERCRAMCDHPCAPTPAEAAALIANGYWRRLMLEFWYRAEAAGGTIYYLVPATPGRESRQADTVPGGGCVMQKRGLCALHRLGLKPVEGRLAYHDTSKCVRGISSGSVRQAVVTAWDTDEGRALVADWKAMVSL